MKNNPRTQAVVILQQLFRDGKSLTQLFSQVEDHEEVSLIKALCFGVTRYYFKLDFMASQLLQKPLKEKDQDVYLLMLVGLYQLAYMRIPDHAAINETVKAVKDFKKAGLKNLVNAVLRNFQRKQNVLLSQCGESEGATFSHPQWLINKIKKAYPKAYEKILKENNEQAPMSLRVNQQEITRDAYLKKLSLADPSEDSASENRLPRADIAELMQAIILKEPVPVDRLPGFLEGECFVQDLAAQLAAPLLRLKPNQRVLDACAAPGGKATHLLEIEPSIQLTAVDNEMQRIERIEENLERLNQRASVICEDVTKVESWWDGEKFDRILLDAPCSATGVIRRHPDIKLLRRETDIKTLAETQLSMLKTLWPLLKPEGLLLYATCSIFPEENVDVIEQFLSMEKTAKLIAFDASWGASVKYGRQILPGQDEMDGFYYCLLGHDECLPE